MFVLRSFTLNSAFDLFKNDIQFISKILLLFQFATTPKVDGLKTTGGHGIPG